MKIDLSQPSSLPIFLDTESNELVSEIIKNEPSVRMLSDVKGVLFDKSAIKHTKDCAIYYMYRNICKPCDSGLFKENGVRYDLTVVPPFIISVGNEFVKTFGHYHPFVPNTSVSYPEIYEVLNGEGHFLLQKISGNEITDCVLVKGHPCDKIIIPPNYGHVTINPSNEILVTSNLVSDKFESLYEPIKEKNGACYFEILKNKEKKFVKNKNYKKIPELKIVMPKKIIKSPLYHAFVENPKKFEFLNAPQNHTELFPNIFS